MKEQFTISDCVIKCISDDDDELNKSFSLSFILSFDNNRENIFLEVVFNYLMEETGLCVFEVKNFNYEIVSIKKVDKLNKIEEINDKSIPSIDVDSSKKESIIYLINCIKNTCVDMVSGTIEEGYEDFIISTFSVKPDSIIEVEDDQHLKITYHLTLLEFSKKFDIELNEIIYSTHMNQDFHFCNDHLRLSYSKLGFNILISHHENRYGLKSEEIYNLFESTGRHYLFRSESYLPDNDKDASISEPLDSGRVVEVFTIIGHNTNKIISFEYFFEGFSESSENIQVNRKRKLKTIDNNSLTQIRKLNKGYDHDFDWKILDENYYNNNSFKSIIKESIESRIFFKQGDLDNYPLENL